MTRLLHAAHVLNDTLARVWLRTRGERSCLVVLNFHAFPTVWDEHRPILEPRYCLQLVDLVTVIEHFLKQEYRAIGVADLLRGIGEDRRHVLFTFDDGYANHLRVLEVLERFRVPGLFAIATDYVESQRAFWWDVLFRRLRDLGKATSQAQVTIDSLIRQPKDELARLLRDRHGVTDLTPVGNDDRPLNRRELCELARHPLATLANHSACHSWLPACSESEIDASLRRCQAAFEQWCGRAPETLVYPFGSHDHRVESVARKLGFRFAFTGTPKKRSVPFANDDADRLALPRFCFTSGQSVESQCIHARLDWKPSWSIPRGRR